MEEALKKMKELGFELTKPYSEEVESIRFERVDFEGEKQYVDIDNYTWETEEPDFDPNKGFIGDWLVESYCLSKDSDGSRLIWAYALTFKEMQAICELIKELDKKYGNGGDKD